MRGFSLFFARLFTNNHKDLFVTRLGVTLLLGKFNLTGPIADFVGFFFRSIVGFLMEVGIFQIELTLDAYREGQKLKEFEKAAEAAFKKATAKIYDEETKNEIRMEYLRIIRLIGNVGNPKQ